MQEAYFSMRLASQKSSNKINFTVSSMIFGSICLVKIAMLFSIRKKIKDFHFACFLDRRRHLQFQLSLSIVITMMIRFFRSDDVQAYLVGGFSGTVIR